jgi:hypothetical protein
MKTYAITVNLAGDEEFTHYHGVQYESKGIMEDIEQIQEDNPTWTSITITIVRGTPCLEK